MRRAPGRCDLPAVLRTAEALADPEARRALGATPATVRVDDPGEVDTDGAALVLARLARGGVGGAARALGRLGAAGSWARVRVAASLVDRLLRRALRLLFLALAVPWLGLAWLAFGLYRRRPPPGRWGPPAPLDLGRPW